MNRRSIVIALAICLAVVALASAFASAFPDGLEWVAEQTGFIESASEAPVIASPLPDYSLPFIASPFWSGLSAGAIGVAIVFGFFWIFRLLFRGRASSTTGQE